MATRGGDGRGRRGGRGVVVGAGALLAAGLVLAGCGGPAPAAPPSSPVPSAAAPPKTTVAPTTTTTVPVTPPADGTDVAACEDGTCEVEVRSGTEITFDAGTGVESVRIRGVASSSFGLVATGTTGAETTVSITNPRPGSSITSEFEPLVDGAPLQYRLVRITPSGTTAVLALRLG